MQKHKTTYKGSNEPEDFGEHLKHMNTEFFGKNVSTPMVTNLAESPMRATPTVPLTHNGKMRNNSKSDAHLNSRDSFKSSDTLRYLTQNRMETIRDGESIDGSNRSELKMIQINVDQMDSPDKLDRDRKKSCRPNVSYKVQSVYEGAFAFKSKYEMQQPDYPLAFVERNLAFQLEYESMQETSMRKVRGGKDASLLGKGTSMLGVALRTFVLKRLKEYQAQKNQSQWGKVGEKLGEARQGIKVTTELQKFIKQIENKKQTTSVNLKIIAFPLSKVRYYDDRKFPFIVKRDVPQILAKSLENINQSNFMIHPEAEEIGGIEGENDLQIFLRHNESAFSNIVTYCFWIVVSDLFHDLDAISFPKEFIEEVRQALTNQYGKIHFNYLIRLKQSIADGIIEVLPFLLAETVKYAIHEKLKNHELPLHSEKSRILLASIMFRELIGYETSDLCLNLGRKKFITHPDTNLIRINKLKKPAARDLQRTTTNNTASSGRVSFAGSSMKQPDQSEKTMTKAKSNSIFSVKTYEQKRDPNKRKDCDPMKIYADEIKADMVNEMVKTFNKVESSEVKMAISDQINELNDVQKPAEILAADQKQSQRKRDMFTGSLFSSTRNLLGGRHNTIVSNGSLQRKSTMKRQDSISKLMTKMDRTPGSTPAKQNYNSHEAFGQHLLARSPKNKSKFLALNRQGSISKQFKSSQNVLPLKLDEINEETKSLVQQKKQQSQAADTRNFAEKAGILTNRTMFSILGNLGLENKPLKRQEKKERIDPSQKTVNDLKGILGKLKHSKQGKKTADEQRFADRVRSAHDDRSKVAKHRKDQMKSRHMLQKGRKFSTDDCRRFDLQYMTPSVRTHFSTQLLKSHYPNRKQKNILVQQDGILEKTESYQEKIEDFLQQKKAGDVRRVKEKKLESEKEIEDEIKGIMSGHAQKQVMYSYAREANAVELQKADAEQAAQQVIAKKKKQLHEQKVMQGSSSKAKNLNLNLDSIASTGLGDIELTRAATVMTRGDVKFEPKEEIQLRTMNMNGEGLSRVQSAMTIQKKVFFFQDNNYYDAQKTWELKKATERKQSVKNIAIEAHELSLFRTTDSPSKQDSVYLSKKSIQGINEFGAQEHNTERMKNEKQQSMSNMKMNKAKSMQVGFKQTVQKVPSKLAPVPIQNSRKPQKEVSLVTGIRFGTISSTKHKRRNDSDIALEEPFSEKDIAMQSTRKTSKIIRETKSVAVEKGPKAPPMHMQLTAFLKQYPEKVLETDKKQVEELIVRKRIDDTLPSELKKSSNYFKSPPPKGFLTDKHTYASMRKVSNHKSKKLFNFDGFTTKEKIKKENYNQALAQAEKPKPLQKTRTYRVFRGSNFEQISVDNDSTEKDSENKNKRQYLKPPKPMQAGRKSAMLHTMNLERGMTGENDLLEVKYTIEADDSGRKRPLSSYSGSQMSSNQNGHEDSFRGKDLNRQERQHAQMHMRKIAMKNENDDKADVRDGIAETKGMKRELNKDYRSVLKLVPRDQNTKVFKMLKQQRKFNQREEKMKAKRIEDAICKDIDIDDLQSGDEQERHNEGSDIIISRPNPLEPKKKEEKKKTQHSIKVPKWKVWKRMYQSNKDSKGYPMDNKRRSESERQLPTVSIPQLGLFNGSQTQLKQHHFD